MDAVSWDVFIGGGLMVASMIVVMLGLGRFMIMPLVRQMNAMQQGIQQQISRSTR